MSSQIEMKNMLYETGGKEIHYKMAKNLATLLLCSIVL